MAVVKVPWITHLVWGEEHLESVNKWHIHFLNVVIGLLGFCKHKVPSRGLPRVVDQGQQPRRGVSANLITSLSLVK